MTNLLIIVNRSQENGLANANVNGAIGNQQQILDKIELSLEELDAIRTREISGKAATGIVILLLKWLKTSRMFLFIPCFFIRRSLLDTWSKGNVLTRSLSRCTQI